MADPTNGAGDLPTNHNITVVQLATVLIALGAIFGLNLDPVLAGKIAAVVISLGAVVTLLLHYFVNTPAQKTAVRAMLAQAGQAASKAARRSNGLLLAVFLGSTLMLGGCASLFSNPQQDLNNLETAFNAALAIYNGVCETNASASFCTTADLATAATLEKAITDAIQLAQVAIQANNGAILSSSDVSASIQKVTDAINNFASFVNNLQAAKAAAVAAKARAGDLHQESYIQQGVPSWAWRSSISWQLATKHSLLSNSMKPASLLAL